jgi:hypothetical protein
MYEICNERTTSTAKLFAKYFGKNIFTRRGGIERIAVDKKLNSRRVVAHHGDVEDATRTHVVVKDSDKTDRRAKRTARREI